MKHGVLDAILRVTSVRVSIKKVTPPYWWRLYLPNLKARLADGIYPAYYLRSVLTSSRAVSTKESRLCRQLDSLPVVLDDEYLILPLYLLAIIYCLGRVLKLLFSTVNASEGSKRLYAYVTVVTVDR